MEFPHVVDGDFDVDLYKLLNPGAVFSLPKRWSTTRWYPSRKNAPSVFVGIGRLRGLIRAGLRRAPGGTAVIAYDDIVEALKRLHNDDPGPDSRGSNVDEAGAGCLACSRRLWAVICNN